jgi:glucose/arabinose dehydrogenase
VRTLAAIVVAVAGTLLLGGAGSASGASDAFRKVVQARGFDAPVLLTYAPGEPGTVYVVEQSGRVIQLKAGRRRVFLDVRRQITYGGEQGLLGLAFHPSYARNRLLYVAYTSSRGENVVARFRSNSSAAILSTQRTLLSVADPYGNHNGGHLAFGPDRMLYTSIGDGGSGGDPENRAQNPDSPFGKLLRLDVSKPQVDWEKTAFGLRNPWRFSFDRVTGDLYIGDVGQGSVEEVDFTPRRSPGLENYGWNRYEGSQRYASGDPGPGTLVFPVFEYGHDRGCSVTGGYVYRGSARPAERGRYVFGDYCSGTIWSFRVSAGKAVELRTEPFKIASLSSFGENSAGELFAVSLDGTIFRLT